MELSPESIESARSRWWASNLTVEPSPRDRDGSEVGRTRSSQASGGSIRPAVVVNSNDASTWPAQQPASSFVERGWRPQLLPTSSGSRPGGSPRQRLQVRSPLNCARSRAVALRAKPFPYFRSEPLCVPGRSTGIEAVRRCADRSPSTELDEPGRFPSAGQVRIVGTGGAAWPVTPETR